jgi:hypothetical protein
MHEDKPEHLQKLCGGGILGKDDLTEEKSFVYSIMFINTYYVKTKEIIGETQATTVKGTSIYINSHVFWRGG